MPIMSLEKWSEYLPLEIRVLWRWVKIPFWLGAIFAVGDLGLSLSSGLARVADDADLVKSLYYGEMLLPLATGWASARLVLHDEAREILLITPAPYWLVSLRRLLLLMAIISATWIGAFLLAAAILRVPEAGQLILRILLGGLAAIFFFGSIGFATAVLLRSYLWGTVLTTLLWCAALALIRSATSLALLHPFLTWVDAFHPFWPANRIVVSCAAGIFLALGCWRLHDGSVLRTSIESNENL